MVSLMGTRISGTSLTAAAAAALLVALALAVMGISQRSHDTTGGRSQAAAVQTPPAPSLEASGDRLAGTIRSVKLANGSGSFDVITVRADDGTSYSLRLTPDTAISIPQAQGVSAVGGPRDLAAGQKVDLILDGSARANAPVVFVGVRDPNAAGIES